MNALFVLLDGDEFFDNDFLTSYQSFSSSPGTRQKSSDTEPQGEDDRASQFTSRDIPQNESQQPEMTSPSPRTNDDDSEREDSQESCQHIYDDLSIADLIKGNYIIECLSVVMAHFHNQFYLIINVIWNELKNFIYRHE